MTRPLLLILLLTACSAQQFADDVTRRAAGQVVLPVVGVEMPSGAAQAATACILDAATTLEQQALARDLGVEAGTLTVQTIRMIAARSAVQSCFAAAAVPPLRV